MFDSLTKNKVIIGQKVESLSIQQLICICQVAA